nr:alpha-galactosidase [Propionibacteriaceae bacterium]
MNAAEPDNTQHIEFGNEHLTVALSYAQDAPVTLTRLICDGCRLELDALELPSGVPLVELQTPEAGHQTPVQSMAHTDWGQRLRYRNHELSSEGGWQRLTVDLNGDDGIDVRLELRMPADVAAFTSQITVTNRAAADLVLTSVPSLSMPVSGTLDGTVIDADGLDVWQGANDWLGENRWSSGPLRNSVVDLFSAGHGVEAKAGLAARSLGTWSTAAEVPSGVIGPRDGGFALAWQIEHNGAWCWEVGESLGSVRLTLSGPTDRHHQWVEVLASGESFRTVPVTVSVGRSWEDAVGWLTRYRRAARRPHPDNTRLTLIYNDYMNTLMGDPTTERLLPLIDAAADVGAEAFCIDAGWYDDGLNWWDSVGAWQPSPSRFPGGLAEVLERIRGRGMVAGLWLEPEVVGVRSEMAEALPPEAFFSRYGLRVREAGRYH